VILNVQISQYTEEFSSNAGASVPRHSVRVGFAILPFTLTADSTLPNALSQAINWIEIKLIPGILTAQCFTSCSYLNGVDKYNPGVLANNGGNLYTWFESPPLSPVNNTPPTITITSVEF
jgi:hypothetical protein